MATKAFKIYAPTTKAGTGELANVPVFMSGTVTGVGTPDDYALNTVLNRELVRIGSGGFLAITPADDQEKLPDTILMATNNVQTPFYDYKGNFLKNGKILVPGNEEAIFYRYDSSGTNLSNVRILTTKTPSNEAFKIKFSIPAQSGGGNKKTVEIDPTHLYAIWGVGASDSGMNPYSCFAYIAKGVLHKYKGQGSGEGQIDVSIDGNTVTVTELYGADGAFGFAANVYFVDIGAME